MRCSLLLPALLSFILSAGLAQADQTKIVLHSIQHEDRVHCYMPIEQGYSDPATQTVTTVAANSNIDLFVYLVDYDNAVAAGFHLIWPTDWVYYGWGADCLGHQITLTDFLGSSIHIGTAFDVVTGGGLALLGFASFTTGVGGEIGLESTWMCFPESICYVDRTSTSHPIEPGMTGRIAVGGEGYNPAAPLPVEASTWGRIKTQYRDATR